MNPNQNRPRLLYVALAPPRDANSGSLVMHRHLSRLADRVEVSVLHTEELRAGEESYFRLPPRRLYSRLLHTRFTELIRSWEHTRGGFYSGRTMQAVIRQVRPDAILTIAESSLFLTVRRITQKERIPLATIFHDWAPGWPEVPARCRNAADEAFRRMHRESRSSLPVCPELLQHLGGHPNAQVLYPMPDPLARRMDASHSEGRFHVLYAGVFYALYAAELQALSCELERAGSASLLRIVGPNPQWPVDHTSRLERLGIYGGYVSRAELGLRLAAAPALLVISSFQPEYEAYSRYSFPSKIPEYCRYGRPLVVWGPAYAASVAWARRTGAAFVVDDPSPAALIAVLSRLANDPAQQRALGRRAAALAESDFDPERLQDIFEAGLRHVLPQLALR